MKKVLIGTTSLILLFGVFLYSYIRSLDPGELRRILLHEVEKRIHGQCALEELEIGGFGAVYAKGLRVSTLKGQRIFEIAQLNFKLSLSDLIYSNLRFTTLDIKGLKIFADKSSGQWNFENLTFTKAKTSRSPRRLSMEARSKSSGGRPFQIDSFWAEDAQFFVQGQETFRFHLGGKVVDRRIRVENLVIEGPGASKFESSAWYDWSTDLAEIKIDNGKIEAAEIKNIYKLISSEKKLHEVTGLVAISGVINWTDSKLIPNLKINSDKLLISDKTTLSNVEGYWNVSQIQSLMTIDVFPVKSRSKLTLRPLDGEWRWPNEYAVELASDQIVTSALNGQRFKGQLSMLVSTQVAEVSSMSLSSLSEDGDRSLIEADGGFLFEEKSGQFRLTSRDLPLALIFPQHQGMVHWQAQLMLTEHFGLDYEIYGKVQKHASDTLELGDADFHITGQMDRDHFEFSKFSIDVDQNGSIQGSGLFRFADPLGSFRSVLYMDSIHINSLIKSPLITPKTKISSAKVELRNRILNFKSSEVSVAGGKLNVDLSSEIDKDFRKVLSSAKGKLKFEKLLMSELVPSLPYNIPKVPLQLSGYIVPQAEFAINLRALKPGSTNLELLGTNKFGQSVQVPKLQLNGIVDIEDLITDTSFHKFNAKSKFKVIGELKPNKLEFEVNSESLQFQLAETSSPILVKNLESSSVVDFEGNFEFKDIRFDIFSGRVNTVLSGNIYSLESVIANANIKGVSINQLITSINPVMEGHFDGKLNSKLDVIEHTGNSSHTYPVRVIGSFNVSKPSYTYHKSVVGAISSLNKSLNQSFLKKIVKREQRNWQEAIEKKSEFLDTTPQPLYFEDKRIQVQSLQLIEGQRRFSLKTSKPILLDLPDEFRASGYCSTEIQLLATSQFIKEKFKFLKDSYDQDLELVLALEGPINNPISQSQLDVLKQKVIQRIGKNIDPKKVEQAAKEAAKQAAKKLKKNLKKKGQELLNKVLNLSTSDEEKRVSVKQQASVTSAVVDVEKKKSDEVKQQVKKKLRSFLQDLF